MEDDQNMENEIWYVPIKKKHNYGNELKLWLIFLATIVPMTFSLILMHLEDLLLLFFFVYISVLAATIAIMGYFIDENLFKTMYIHMKKYYLLIDPIPYNYSSRKKRPRIYSTKIVMSRIGRRINLKMYSCGSTFLTKVSSHSSSSYIDPHNTEEKDQEK